MQVLVSFLASQGDGEGSAKAEVILDEAAHFVGH